MVYQFIKNLTKQTTLSPPRIEKYTMVRSRYVKYSPQSSFQHLVLTKITITSNDNGGILFVEKYFQNQAKNNQDTGLKNCNTIETSGIADFIRRRCIILDTTGFGTRVEFSSSCRVRLRICRGVLVSFSSSRRTSREHCFARI